jgi:hypothetical protein
LTTTGVDQFQSDEVDQFQSAVDRGNFELTLGRLQAEGKGVKTVDDDRAVWWAFATTPDVEK